MHILEVFSCVCLVVSYGSGTADGIDVSSIVGTLSWTTRITERYLEFEDITLTECARECMKRKRCQSFNYCKVLNYCELSDVTMSDGTPYTNPIKMKTFVHSDISTWRRTLMGECEVNNCDINNTCDMVSGGCNISDCGRTVNVSNAVELAHGHHVVGNRIIYRCAKNYHMVDINGNINRKDFEILECKTNGEWEDPNFKCIDLNADRINYGNHYFLFVNKRVTWLQAVDLCHNMHGILAEPKEKGMSDAVAAEASSRGALYWIGGIYNSTSGWIWQSNGEKLSYTNWKYTIHIPWNIKCIASHYHWYSIDCEYNIYYICQQSSN